MKEVAHGILTPLDVFQVMEGSGMIYAMTLLAFCGLKGRKDMVELLLNEEASMCMRLNYDFCQCHNLWVC